MGGIRRRQGELELERPPYRRGFFRHRVACLLRGTSRPPQCYGPMPKRASAAASAVEGGWPEVNMNCAAGGRSCPGGPSSSTTRRAIAGAGSRKVTGQGASRSKPLQQQRIVRAGEHDRVGAAAVALDEAGRDLGRDRRRRRPAAPLQLRLGTAGEPRASRPASPRSRWRSRGSARGCIRAAPSPRCRAPTRACSRDAAQAGLIAGTVPTNGTAKRARSCGSTSVEAVLQAITTRSGRWAVDQLVHQRRRRARPARPRGWRP